MKNWLLLVFVLALASTAWSQEADRIIRANKFVLEDDQGRERAKLWMSYDGPTLALFDKNGKALILLNVNEAGPAFRLYNEDGKLYLSLSESNLSLVENDIVRATLQLDESGPALLLLDKKYRPIWRAP